MKELDVFEQNALPEMDEAAADYAAQHGTDLANYSEEQRIGLWKQVWLAAGDSIRRQAETNAPPF